MGGWSRWWRPMRSFRKRDRFRVMHFSLYLLVPELRVSSQMREQRRTFAFGGDEVECEPQRYHWADDVHFALSGRLPELLMKHVPASHRRQQREVVWVGGGLYSLAGGDIDENPPGALERLLRVQLADD